MKLQNNSKRAITINGPLVEGQRNEAYRIKCGLDNVAEVPDELCDNAFVNGLIADGSLTRLSAPAEPVSADGLIEMTRAELAELAESMDIEVQARWNKTDIVEAIRDNH